MTQTWMPGTDDWNSAQWQAAAAALGRFVVVNMRSLAALPDGDTPEHAYRAGANAELQRVIVNAAIDAAHYAGRAEQEADLMAGFLLTDARARHTAADVALRFQHNLLDAIDPRD